MSNAKVGIDITADASKASDEFGRFKKSGTESLDKIKKSSVALKAALTVGVAGAAVVATAALAGVAVVARKFVEVSAEWIEASNKQEDAVNALNASLESTGQLTPELSQKYQDLASAFQAVTTTGDEELLPMMGKLASIGGIQEDQMKASTQAALDLAAGLGMDLNSAVLMVSKAATGNTDTLSRYGIAFEKTGDKAADFEAVLKLINAQFGGQAQAKAETFSGKIKQLSNRWGDVKEMMGAALKEALLPMLGVMSKGVTFVENFVKAHRTDLILGFAKGLSFIVKALGLATKVGALYVAGLGDMIATIGGPLIAVLSLKLEKLGDVARGAGALARAVGAKGLSADLERAGWSMKGLARASMDSVEGLVKAGESIKAFGIRSAGAADTMTDKLVGALDKTIAKYSEMGKATGALRGDTEDFRTTFKNLGSDIRGVAGALTVLPRKAAPEATKALGEVELKANDTAVAVERIATAAEQIGPAAAAGAAEAIKHIEKLNTVVSVALGGAPGSFDAKGDETGSIDHLLKLLSKFKTAGGLASGYAQSAMEAIRSGDILALTDIARVLQQQATTFLSTSTFAPGVRLGNMELATQLSGMGNALSDLIAQLSDIPKRAFGGGFQPGPVLVGERGPEVASFSRAGEITPSHRLGGLGGESEEARAERRQQTGLLARLVAVQEAALARGLSVVLDGAELARAVTSRQQRNELGVGLS